jgi:hypothetical protein
MFVSLGLQQRGSTAAMQMEIERLRSELRRALNNGQQWQQLHQELYCFCVDELIRRVKETKRRRRRKQREGLRLLISCETSDGRYVKSTKDNFIVFSFCKNR